MRASWALDSSLGRRSSFQLVHPRKRSILRPWELRRPALEVKEAKAVQPELAGPQELAELGARAELAGPLETAGPREVGEAAVL